MKIESCAFHCHSHIAVKRDLYSANVVFCSEMYSSRSYTELLFELKVAGRECDTIGSSRLPLQWRKWKWDRRIPIWHPREFGIEL
jgi:hypothetical protein